MDFLKDNRIAVAMMRASTTYLFQMIDVVVGKPFKDAMCDMWAEWMLKNCGGRVITPAGNFKHATVVECLQWVTEAWEGLSMEGVKKKAEELGMAENPGPPVAGCVDQQFIDVQAQGHKIDVVDDELGADLEAAEIYELAEDE